MRKKQKWQKWLKNDIKGEARYLIKLRTAYLTLQSIFVNSQTYPWNNEFYWYIAQVHVAAIVAGVYRILDKRSDVATLGKLLEEVRENPQLVSRRSYTQLRRRDYRSKKDYKITKHVLDSEFTQLAGTGKYLDPAIVDDDIRQTAKITRKIRPYRNKFLAHHAFDQQRYKINQTLKEIHESIDTIDIIFQRYFQLITYSGKGMKEDLIKKMEEDVSLFFNKPMSNPTNRLPAS